MNTYPLSITNDNIFLKLPELEKIRLIGQLRLSEDKKIFLCYRKPEHLFRKYGGYGFNLEIVNKLLDYWFVVKTEHYLYFAHRETIVSEGIVVKYKKFERQVVLPLQFFKMEKINDNKKRII